jgi:hypothetical protein
MTVWRMRIAFWITKVTDTHSEYVIFIALPLQQWFHDRASMLSYTDTVSVVSSQSWFSRLPSTWITSHNSAVRANNIASEVEYQFTEQQSLISDTVTKTRTLPVGMAFCPAVIISAQ